MENATILSVSRHDRHAFSKTPEDSIRLLAGLGVEGDAHCGATVQHRSRVAQNPDQPNLRQVHLIAAELFEELASKGFSIQPGAMGENVTTRGIDLLALPLGTRLHLGAEAVVEVTGLRNPCKQIDAFQPGLMQAVLGRDETGALVLRAGIMGVVIAGGAIRRGDAIHTALPPLPHIKLQRV